MGTWIGAAVAALTTVTGVFELEASVRKVVFVIDIVPRAIYSMAFFGNKEFFIELATQTDARAALS